MYESWAPATRARIQAVIDENANKGRYVVFDFDNTSVIFDIQEALLVYQIENLIFKIKPEEMQGVDTYSKFCDYIESKVGDK